MITVAPAAGVSIVLIFCAGAYFTGVFLENISKDIKRYPSFYGNTINKIVSYLTENVKQKLSLFGGGIAVGFLILLIINVPAEWKTIIWYGLTIIGILFGIYTFLNISKK